MDFDCAIIGDTHCIKFKDLPTKLVKIIKNQAEWLIHVGDYNRMDVLEGFMELKKSKFIGVCGNADPLNIVKRVVKTKIISIEGKKIGITHPYSGGSDYLTKSKVLHILRNKNLDFIVYGHTHDINIERFENFVLINPGKGYIDNTPASIILVNFTGEADIKVIKFKHS